MNTVNEEKYVPVRARVVTAIRPARGGCCVEQNRNHGNEEAFEANYGHLFSAKKLRKIHISIKKLDHRMMQFDGFEWLSDHGI